LKRHVNATWTPPFLPWRLRRPNLRNLLHYKLLRISILYILYILYHISILLHLTNIPSKALWSCPSIPIYSRYSFQASSVHVQNITKPSAQTIREVFCQFVM
jgi:hypothetical protein